MFIKRHVALACLGLALSALTVGCSDNNDLGEIDRPEFQLEEPNGAVLLLQLPEQPNRPRLQDGKLRLRSTGKAELVVSSIEWIDQPQGVYIQKTRNEVASCDTDCNSAICLKTGAKDVCIDTGFPDLPLKIPAGQLYDIQLFIEANVDELNCPPAPADVPPIVGQDYCGAIKIKTNAANTGANVTNGEAIVYLTNSGASGKLNLTETFIQFTGVSPGFTATRTFGIENVGSSPLSISTIQAKENASFFTINGDFNTEIAPNSSKQYTVQLNIPAEAMQEQLKFTTELVINSTAVNANLGKIVISVTNEQGDVPQIQVGPTTLKFDQSGEQDLNVENVGGATLIVNSVSFEPSSLSNFYTVELNGSQFTSSENIQAPNAQDPERSKRTFKVKFTRPQGNTDSASGVMYLNHNDDGAGKRTRIVLLGDAGDVPFAEVLPFSFSFDTGVAGNQERSFVIVNYGTAPLDITGVEIPVPPQGTSDEFQLNLGNITIPAGGIYEGTMLFSSANMAPDNVAFKIQSNTSGTPLQLNAVSVPNGGAAPVAKIKKSFAAKAKVGERAIFDASDSTPAGAVSSASWTLLARPDGSTTFLNTFGAKAGFTPDVAGTYRIALTVVDGAYDNQDIIEFVAE